MHEVRDDSIVCPRKDKGGYVMQFAKINNHIDAVKR